MAAAAVVSATLQQSKAILSTGSPASFRGHVRSEFVAQATAHGVDIHLSGRGKADVFPLGTQEQTADQIDIDTQTCRIAIDQMVMLGHGRTQESWGESRRVCWPRGGDVQHGYGTADVRVAERKPAEQVWQEAFVGVTGASAECRHVRDRDCGLRCCCDLVKVMIR